MAAEPERPVVNSPSFVVLAGSSSVGKSWQLYRLGFNLVEQGSLVILLQGSGNVNRDEGAVAIAFCQQILGESSTKPLRDIRDQMRTEFPELRQPWLTVLIDGVRDATYADQLRRHPWQELGVLAVVGYQTDPNTSAPTSDRTVLEETGYSIQLDVFTDRQLGRYLTKRSRARSLLAELPNDVKRFIRNPLLAKLFCDLHVPGATWNPATEYQLFERAWTLQTSSAPVAASAVAGLAALIPYDQVYPWPITRLWAAGLRDGDVQALVDSGLLRFPSGSRSAEIWHDRILNWAVAEGLVGALRSIEIDAATLISRAIQGPSGEGLQRRLDYVALDTLWLLTTPEFGLDNVVGQFLAALDAQWTRRQRRQLKTLGARISPHLVARLANTPNSEEEI
jgi:hypothetical protein